MPTINIRGTGAAGYPGGQAGGSGSGADPIFAAFRKWLKTGSPGDLDALIAESQGKPSVARFFGIGQKSLGTGGASSATMPAGVTTASAAVGIPRPVNIRLSTPPGAAPGTGDPRIADGLARLAAISQRILAASEAEVTATRHIGSSPGGAGLRWIGGPPTIPGAAAAAKMAAAPTGSLRWIAGAPVAPGSQPTPPRPAPGFVSTGGGGWITGPPLPPRPPAPPVPPPPRMPLRLPHPHLGGIWSLAGGAIGGGLGLFGGPETAIAGAAIGAEAGRFLGRLTRTGAAATGAAIGTLLAGRPWNAFAMNAMGISVSAGLPYARWRGLLTPSLGTVNSRLAALGIGPREALTMMRRFPGYAVGSAAQNIDIIAQLGRARFMPGLSMLSPAQQEAAGALQMRFRAFGRGGSMASGIARAQSFMSGQMTAAAVAGTSPQIFESTLQQSIANISRMAPGPTSASGIAGVVSPYFASGLGPAQASAMSQQMLAGPPRAMTNVYGNAFRGYLYTLLSQRAASAGLGSVIGSGALAALQKTTGGRSLIAQYRESVRVSGASSPISTQLLASILRTAYPYDPKAIQRDWRNIIAPSIGANAAPGLSMLAESRFLGVKPETLAFGSGPPLPSATVPRNNPLNIRSGPHGFRQFGTIGQGFSAADKLLQTYASKYHLNTIRGIINRWAPPSENNTAAYIAHVSKWTGLTLDERLDMADPRVRAKLESAMARQESGLRISPSQVRLDIQNGTNFGQGALGSAAPGRVIAYGPRTEGATLGASRVANAAGQKIIESLSGIAEGLSHFGTALENDTTALEAHTTALGGHPGHGGVGLAAAIHDRAMGHLPARQPR